MHIDAAVCISPNSIKVGSNSRCCYTDEVTVCRTTDIGTDTLVVYSSRIGNIPIFFGIIEDCIGNGSNELITAQRTAAAGIGNQVIVGGCSIGATIHLEVCLSATGRVIVGSTIRKTAYLRIAVICKSMMQVFKCQTILYNVCCWNRRTTQLETVSVTVVVTTSVFCPTISECYTILQRYDTGWACFCFSK